MEIYSSAIGYGFLILIALFFLFFMMNENTGFMLAENKQIAKTKKQTDIQAEKQVSKAFSSFEIPANIASRLKLIYYSLISLILLNFIILFLLIF